MGVEWGVRIPRCGICHDRHLSLLDQVRGDGFCGPCHRAFPVITDRASTGWVARFKLRRESFRQDSRGSTADRPAPGPRVDASASHTALTVSPGAALCGEEGKGLGISADRQASCRPSSSRPEVRHG